MHPVHDHPRSTADLVRTSKERVLATWEERVRARLPDAAGGASRPALRNSLPIVIDHIGVVIEALATRAGDEPDPTVGAPHGEHRADEPECSLGEIIIEYQLLRQVLLEVLEERAPLPPPARDRLLDVIEVAVRGSCEAFVRRRDQERHEAAEALRQANADLDERVRQRSAELARTEERFRRLVEGVRDHAIFTVDPIGDVTSWNVGAERMKQYTADEILGVHYSILYPDEAKRRDEPMSHLRSAALEGRFRGEGMRVRKSGEAFLADVLITPMYEDARLVGFSKVVQDLSERTSLIHERDRTRVDVEHLKLQRELRDRFVTTLTHDLRSPLSSARYCADLIARSPERHDDVRRWSRRVSEIIGRADGMISDLLDATRLEAGEGLPMQLGACDLAAIVSEVVEELAGQHGRRFVVRTDGDTTGVWSAEGLRRLLENLLSNAIKYGEASTPITTSIRRVDDRVLLAVHNRGAMIDVEDQERLFQPFQRSRSAEASGAKGWGLGLTLVRGIVEAHRGIVMLESYPREGTTFTIDLPVDAGTAAPPVRPTPPTTARP